ncbi:MAG TPA: twin-arginine translocase TatA/TatE family subunit [Actinomycetota bacterium]|nr:twin-arginine translocase TatA/TatE family subunit [Actinomycetota bacterium]
MLDNLFAPDKLLLVAIVGLVLFGPKRLPQIGRSVGRWLGEFRKAAGGLGDELKAGMHSDEAAQAEGAAASTASAVVVEKPAVPAVSVPVDKPAGPEPGPTPPAAP